MRWIPRSVMASMLITFVSLTAAAQDNAGVEGPPAELFAPVGTVLTIQVRDPISSDKSAAGDSFIGMLQQPLVIDGWVVARPGQTVIGEVTVANSAGRVKGTSDLGLRLTEIVLVDGHQAPIRTQLLHHSGKESRDEDAVTIAGATALGTVIGAIAGGGKGALIGAGIGAGAGTAGVLSTRGKSVEIYPESTLTFRLDAPLVVSTVRSGPAFVPVVPEDYDNAPSLKVPAKPDRHGTPYESYDRYPRFPGRARVGVPAVVVVPPVVPVVIHGGRGRHRY